MYMPGTIRFIIGLFLVLGAVGTIDVDPNASFIAVSMLAIVGLTMMAWSVKAMNNGVQ